MSLNIYQISKLNQLTIDYIKKKTCIQLKELKNQIDTSITFFSSSYIDIDCSDDKLTEELLEQKYTHRHKLMITNGYDNIGKINMMFEMIQTSDKSQTNKFKYEEASKNIYSLGQFLNMFNELSTISLTKNIDKCLDIGEINKNWSDNTKVNEIDNLYKDKEAFLLNEKINVFNHYINTIIIQLCKIKLHLQDTYCE